MNYVVMDLEFNWIYGKDLCENNGISLRNEIIEIGAVKLDESLNGIGSFNTYIHPVAYPVVNKKVQKLTGITSQMLWYRNIFPETMNRFLNWCGEDYSFICWSQSDIKAIKENMLYHGMDLEGLSICYDIQKMFDDQVTKIGQAIALGKAIAMLEINFKGRHMHDALYDAIGTAEVLRKLDLDNGLNAYMVS